MEYSTPAIALLTDFGTTDPYVGVMKGVIHSICPQAQVIDLTHAVLPQQIRQAAFLLEGSVSYFAPGTVFLVVIDPGVGTARRSIAIRAGGYFFVGPDNGVFSYVCREMETVRVVELTNSAYHLPLTSRTFHGRDVFAPVAAHLAYGVRLEMLGEPVADRVDLPSPMLGIKSRHITGEVLHVDHFGNIITSIGFLRWQSSERLTFEAAFGDVGGASLDAKRASVVVGDGQKISPLRRTYGEAAPGDLMMLVSSGGFLELAVNQGSAASRLNVSIGDKIELEMGD